MENTGFIVGGNSTGKTKKLLQYAKENNALVVCKNAAAMEAKAAAHGIYGLRFIYYTDMFSILDDKKVLNVPMDKFVVDEIGTFMEYLFSTKCVGFTQTED